VKGKPPQSNSLVNLNMYLKYIIRERVTWKWRVFLACFCKNVTWYNVIILLAKQIEITTHRILPSKQKMPIISEKGSIYVSSIYSKV